MDLFEWARTHPAPKRRPETIAERFDQFHRKNPEVYRLLKRFALEARAAGRRRLGIEVLWGRLRWYTAVETTDPTNFKLNDHYTSRYARLLQEQEPGLAGMFETRRLRSD